MPPQEPLSARPVKMTPIAIAAIRPPMTATVRRTVSTLALNR